MPFSAGCGIAGLQYVVRKDEGLLSEGSLVSRTCSGGLDPCPDAAYTTGVGWETVYYLSRVSYEYIDTKRGLLDHMLHTVCMYGSFLDIDQRNESACGLNFVVEVHTAIILLVSRKRSPSTHVVHDCEFMG